MGLPDSFFAGDQIEQRDVTLPDGTTHTLNFRRLTVVEMRRFHIDETSDNPDIKAKSMARLISSSLVEQDGKLSLSFERAQQLNASASSALVEAILSVNQVGESEKKGSGSSAESGSTSP